MIETMGSRITELREQSGMSQSTLARRMHISRASVQSWESGVNLPSTDNLICLAKIFHVSTDYLLDINATETINLDHYNSQEQGIVLRLLQYFDDPAYAAYKEE